MNIYRDKKAILESDDGIFECHAQEDLKEFACFFKQVRRGQKVDAIGGTIGIILVGLSGVLMTLLWCLT